MKHQLTTAGCWFTAYLCQHHETAEAVTLIPGYFTIGIFFGGDQGQGGLGDQEDLHGQDQLYLQPVDQEGLQ